MIVIENIVKTIPRSRKIFWRRRELEQIENIVIHQAMGETNTLAVNAYHMSAANHITPGRELPSICYHFSIEMDGRAYKVNDLESIVYGAKGANTNGIHVLCCGNFSGRSYVGTQRATPELKMGLTHVLSVLKTLNLAWKIKFHSDYGKDNCPGYDVENAVNAWERLIFTNK